VSEANEGTSERALTMVERPGAFEVVAVLFLE
jgi:hypothetical protein